jgi:hypothetical protein
MAALLPGARREVAGSQAGRSCRYGAFSGHLAQVYNAWSAWMRHA